MRAAIPVSEKIRHVYVYVQAEDRAQNYWRMLLVQVLRKESARGTLNGRMVHLNPEVVVSLDFLCTDGCPSSPYMNERKKPRIMTI